LAFKTYGDKLLHEEASTPSGVILEPTTSPPQHLTVWGVLHYINHYTHQGSQWIFARGRV